MVIKVCNNQFVIVFISHPNHLITNSVPTNVYNTFISFIVHTYIYIFGCTY